MTLVVIGPATRDLVIVGDDEFQKAGGATYFQSFVFDEFYPDYMAIINCSEPDLACEFPDPQKVKVILKDDTHYFINRYPFRHNRDVREQLSNFADIPILKGDLEDILPEDIDAFVLNPLNRHDFPIETIEFLKSFGVPVFMSVQGFLRLSDVQVNESYTIKLEDFDGLEGILSGVDAIFLDESELDIIGQGFDVGEMVITNGSRGSRILCDGEIRIGAVKCDNVVDTTGCGDTYMAAYVSQKLRSQSAEDAGSFASVIASDKIRYNGPYSGNK